MLSKGELVKAGTKVDVAAKLVSEATWPEASTLTAIPVSIFPYLVVWTGMQTQFLKALSPWVDS